MVRKRSVPNSRMDQRVAVCVDFMIGIVLLAICACVLLFQFREYLPIAVGTLGGAKNTSTARSGAAAHRLEEPEFPSWARGHAVEKETFSENHEPRK